MRHAWRSPSISARRDREPMRIAGLYPGDRRAVVRKDSRSMYSSLSQVNGGGYGHEKAPRGWRLCRRWALQQRRDTPYLREILRVTKYDTLSEIA